MITGQYDTEVFDAEEVRQHEHAGDIVWTLCQTGDVSYIVLRVSIADVFGYTVIPAEMNIV